MGWAQAGEGMGGGGISGENKPFAALIESLSLSIAAALSRKCLFTTWPLWESFIKDNLISISKIQTGIK